MQDSLTAGSTPSLEADLLELARRRGMRVGPRRVGLVTYTGGGEATINVLRFLVEQGHGGGWLCISKCSACRERILAEAAHLDTEHHHAVELSCACEAWLTGEVFVAERLQ